MKTAIWRDYHSPKDSIHHKRNDTQDKRTRPRFLYKLLHLKQHPCEALSLKTTVNIKAYFSDNFIQQPYFYNPMQDLFHHEYFFL